MVAKLQTGVERPEQVERMSIIGIVQARTYSSRYPGKIFADIQGAYVLQWVLSFLDELRDWGHIQAAAIVTTSDPMDDAIVAAGKEYDIRTLYRGDDLVERFVKATTEYDYCLRVCADTPFLDRELAIDLVELCEKQPGADYYGYVTERGYPAVQTYYGLTVEIFKMASLRWIYAQTRLDPQIKEHVTTGFYCYPSLHQLRWLQVPREIQTAEPWCSVDTIEDEVRCNRIAKYCGPSLEWQSICHYLGRHPEDSARRLYQGALKVYAGPTFEGVLR